MAEMFRGVHILIVLEHPLGALQIGYVFFHVRHYLVDVFTLGQSRVVLLLVEVILCIEKNIYWDRTWKVVRVGRGLPRPLRLSGSACNSTDEDQCWEECPLIQI